jgi:hypothetical protein
VIHYLYDLHNVEAFFAQLQEKGSADDAIACRLCLPSIDLPAMLSPGQRLNLSAKAYFVEESWLDSIEGVWRCCAFLRPLVPDIKKLAMLVQTDEETGQMKLNAQLDVIQTSCIDQAIMAQQTLMGRDRSNKLVADLHVLAMQAQSDKYFVKIQDALKKQEDNAALANEPTGELPVEVPE